MSVPTLRQTAIMMSDGSAQVVSLQPVGTLDAEQAEEAVEQPVRLQDEPPHDRDRDDARDDGGVEADAVHRAEALDARVRARARRAARCAIVSGTPTTTKMNVFEQAPEEPRILEEAHVVVEADEVDVEAASAGRAS